MFYFLKGTLAQRTEHLAVLDCGGVGYACHCSQSTLASLHTGTETTLYTSLQVREGDLRLYGFASLEERELFLLLLGVTGVGAKAALSILSATTPEHLLLSIMTGDGKALQIAPGIGKKIAGRIVLELQDKLAKQPMTLPSQTVPQNNTQLPQNKTQDAMTALTVLGYGQAEILGALQGMDTNSLSVQGIIKEALKRLAPEKGARK